MENLEIRPIFCQRLCQTRLFSETMANEAIEMTGKGGNLDERYHNFDYGYRQTGTRFDPDRQKKCRTAELGHTHNQDSNCITKKLSKKGRIKLRVRIRTKRSTKS